MPRRSRRKKLYKPKGHFRFNRKEPIKHLMEKLDVIASKRGMLNEGVLAEEPGVIASKRGMLNEGVLAEEPGVNYTHYPAPYEAPGIKTVYEPAPYVEPSKNTPLQKMPPRKTEKEADIFMRNLYRGGALHLENVFFDIQGLFPKYLSERIITETSLETAVDIYNYVIRNMQHYMIRENGASIWDFVDFFLDTQQYIEKNVNTETSLFFQIKPLHTYRVDIVSEYFVAKNILARLINPTEDTVWPDSSNLATVFLWMDEKTQGFQINPVQLSYLSDQRNKLYHSKTGVSFPFFKKEYLQEPYICIPLASLMPSNTALVREETYQPVLSGLPKRVKREVQLFANPDRYLHAFGDSATLANHSIQSQRGYRKNINDKIPFLDYGWSPCFNQTKNTALSNVLQSYIVKHKSYRGKPLHPSLSIWPCRTKGCVSIILDFNEEYCDYSSIPGVEQAFEGIINYRKEKPPGKSIPRRRRLKTSIVVEFHIPKGFLGTAIHLLNTICRMAGKGGNIPATMRNDISLFLSNCVSITKTTNKNRRLERFYRRIKNSCIGINQIEDGKHLPFNLAKQTTVYSLEDNFVNNPFYITTRLTGARLKVFTKKILNKMSWDLLPLKEVYTSLHN